MQLQHSIELAFVTEDVGPLGLYYFYLVLLPEIEMTFSLFLKKYY